MSQEKLNSLTKYQTELKNKLEAQVPAKHQAHPEHYKSFLKNELRIVTSKIEAMKLAGTK